MCQECGCMKTPELTMPMLDMSHLWQDGTFYWDRGDGENVPIQDLPDVEVMRAIHFLKDVIKRFKDTYDEAVDVMEFFPDNHRASLLNSMEQSANIMFEFLQESHRRQRKAYNAW